MTFDALERSSYGGQPITLYEFRRGTTQVWRFTSADRDVILDSNTYWAIPISDSGVTQSGEVLQDDVTITMPGDVEPASLFRGLVPAETIWLRIRRLHQGDTEAPLWWIGSISSVDATSRQGAAKVVCNTLMPSFARMGLRLTWDRGCPYMLYDGDCRVDKADFAVNGELTALDAVTLTAAEWAASPDGYFNAGFVEWEVSSGSFERRMIESSAAGVLTLLGLSVGLEVGMVVTAYPGCMRTSQVCEEKFDNLPNYGGFEFMSGKSPFDGNLIF